MKLTQEDLNYKLGKIGDIWNCFILEYKFFKNQIKFTEEIQTNYFGDILGYFKDTFDIIFNYKQSNSYSERFSNHIGLLQSIYVQQDFIEELLVIFKCSINKGDLKNDPNYLINREIRNELIGHPIRKHRGQLISSCLFGYDGKSNAIVYLRYHKDNNYKFESMEYPISEIIDRHKNFLDKYFDKILNKLKKSLVAFLKEIENIQSIIYHKTFQELLKVLEARFESIFKYDYIYDKISLLEVYDRKNEHKRYENFIDKFYEDLKIDLKEKKEYISELLEQNRWIEPNDFTLPVFNIKIVYPSEPKKPSKEPPVTYHYELGKLATKRNLIDFNFFADSLQNKCLENEVVLKELSHMRSNIWNDIEYYSAFRLIYNELNKS